MKPNRRYNIACRNGAPHIKQLLDKVFVISRIIKVEVGLSAEAKDNPYIIRTLHGNYKNGHFFASSLAAKETQSAGT